MERVGALAKDLGAAKRDELEDKRKLRSEHIVGH